MTEAVEKQVAAVPEVKGKYPYPDGVYEGSGQGYKGSVTVAVTLESGTITDVRVVSSFDDEAFFTRAKTLIGSIISGQTPDVDTVSGATYSSYGIIDAVADALEKARLSVEPTEAPTEAPTKKAEEAEATTERGPYKDGLYTGEAVCTCDEDMDFDDYILSVTVRVENGYVVEISNIVGYGDLYTSANDWYINAAANGVRGYEGIAAQVIAGKEAMSADSVSGATCSSYSLKVAIANALAAAK